MYRFLLLSLCCVTCLQARPVEAQTGSLQSVRVEKFGEQTPGDGKPFLQTQPELNRVEFQSLIENEEFEPTATSAIISDSVVESLPPLRSMEELPAQTSAVYVGAEQGQECFDCMQCGVPSCQRSSCNSCCLSKPWCCRCAELHRKNQGHPAWFCERPFGTCNDGFFGAMIVAGKADRAMLHHYDFVHRPDGKVTLSPRGVRQLANVAELVNRYGVPLAIESTYRNGVDAARKRVVIQALKLYGLPVAEDQVVVAADRTIGLSGLDAETIATIRATEIITGASRTSAFRDSSNAVVIPPVQVRTNSGDGSQ